METSQQQTNQTPLLADQHIPHESKWSWGGFMFDPALPIATKRYTLLLWYLLLLIPLVNIIAAIGLKIYFGLKGRELARTSEAFANEDQYKGFMDAYDRVGFVAFWVMVVAVILGLGASLLGAGLFFSGVRGLDGWDSNKGSFIERELCREMDGVWDTPTERCDYKIDELLETEN